MTKERHAEIRQYIDHFHRQHQKIALVRERLHRKILVVTIFATLAEGRYTKLGKGQDRRKFVSLIENDSDWTHATFVSVSLLALTIKQRGTHGLSPAFVRNVNDLFRKRHKNRSQTIDLSAEPSSGELLPKSPNKDETKLVEDMKHSSLLYLYRCKLVHESREQGHGWEFDEDTEPIYRHGELIYPAPWLLNLLPPITARLEAHYTSTGTNPYDAYTFGSPWT